jgi:hypothetical protein
MDTHDPRQPHSDAAGRVDDEVDELFSGANPNPDRVGCPGQEVLAALARKRSTMDDPVYEHIQGCSPCYREFRAFQRASATAVGPSAASLGTRRWFVGVAAVLLLLAIGAVAWRALSVLQRTPISVQAEFDLRPYGASRGDGGNGVKPLVLRRGLLSLTLILPTGAEPGRYDIQLLDADLRSILNATAQAEIREYRTELRTQLPLSDVAPGRYQLAIRYGNERWRLFPAEVQ